MLWVKAWHIIFMVAWFAGLFYLPRLFVYHAASDDMISIARFKIMEKRLYFAITMPAAILTTISGLMLLALDPTLLGKGWMQIKLLLVTALWMYHLYLWLLYENFNNNRHHREIFYRIINEIPTIFLIIIVILVIIKPTF